MNGYARVSSEATASASFDEGISSPAWTGRTYEECLRRAERLVFEGGRVLVDASFREESKRRDFLEAAERWGVPAVLLLCRACPSAVRDRLAAGRGGA